LNYFKDHASGLIRARKGAVTVSPLSEIPERLLFRAQQHTERSDRRFIVNQPARISVPGLPEQVWEARIRDISRRGMQFTVDRQVPAESRVRITWNGRDVFGAVRYQQPDGTEYRLGVELSSSWDSLVSDVLAQQAEELREAESALKKTNEDLAMALEMAREASQAKSRFLASVSHELRTPLNGIIGFTQLLHDGAVGAVSEDQKDCLADVLNCSDHLLTLINHVLDMTKIEAGKMEFHYEEASLHELAAGAIDNVGPLAAAKRIQIELRVDERIGIVQVDAARITQVMLNYLSNALKFTPEGGRVSVEITREDERCYRILVEDTGIGIRSQDLPRLFMEFGQLGGSEKAQSGTGLGLAITKRIVEAQGGRIGVESVFGEGSRFFAVLPG